MRDSGKNDIWIHVHVPKCGGTTLRYVLSRNFGQGYYSGHTLMDHLIYTKQQVAEMLKRNPWITCLSDHKLSLDLPYESECYNIGLICFIRDPVDHFLSHYFWVQNNYKGQSDIQNRSIDEYIDMRQKDNKRKNFMSQLKHLNPVNATEISVDFVKNILLENNNCLLPLDQYDRACIYLEKESPKAFKDLSYVKRNITDKNTTVTEEQRQRIMAIIPDDIEMFKFAQGLFNEKISALFTPRAEQKALDKFKTRCLKRSAEED